MMAEQFIAIKKMNERQARRFRLFVRQVGFTAASLLRDYNPVPYHAVKRHLALCDRYRMDDERWRWHYEMSDYFLMIQKSN